jgi:hypothetical protein
LFVVSPPAEDFCFDVSSSLDQKFAGTPRCPVALHGCINPKPNHAENPLAHARSLLTQTLATFHRLASLVNGNVGTVNCVGFSSSIFRDSPMLL